MPSILKFGYQTLGLQRSFPPVGAIFCDKLGQVIGKSPFGDEKANGKEEYERPPGAHIMCELPNRMQGWGECIIAALLSYATESEHLSLPPLNR